MKNRPSDRADKNGVALRLAITREAHDLTLDWIFRGDPSGLRYDLADAIRAIRTARR